MAAKDKKKRRKKGRGPQPRPMKGFRPGKAPAHLKKKRAKAQLGDDAHWAQERMIDAVADRSPQEVEAMLRKWTMALLVLAIVLGAGGAFLYRWTLVGGLVAHVFTALALFLWYRMRRQGRQMVEMAERLDL